MRRKVSIEFKIEYKTDIQKNQVEEAGIFISLFVLQINHKGLGELYKICIDNDKSGEAPRWYVEEVRLKNMDTNELFCLTVDSWIAKSENDGDEWKEVPVERPCRGPLPGVGLHFLYDFFQS